MAEPMSDEQLAFLRKVHEMTPGSRSDLSKREVGELLAEVDHLRAWKAEAMAVHVEWEATWQAAGRPGRLGGSKAVGVREEVERLRAALAAAERDREQLGTLADSWMRAASTEEARLARVTDEIEGYRDSLDEHITVDDFDRAFTAIRAVAADEQEASDG